MRKKIVETVQIVSRWMLTRVAIPRTFPIEAQSSVQNETAGTTKGSSNISIRMCGACYYLRPIVFFYSRHTSMQLEFSCVTLEALSRLSTSSFFTSPWQKNSSRCLWVSRHRNRRNQSEWKENRDRERERERQRERERERERGRRRRIQWDSETTKRKEATLWFTVAIALYFSPGGPHESFAIRVFDRYRLVIALRYLNIRGTSESYTMGSLFLSLSLSLSCSLSMYTFNEIYQVEALVAQVILFREYARRASELSHW